MGMSLIPFTIFAVIFAVVLITTIVMVCLNAADYEFWDRNENYNGYYNVHISTIYKSIECALFGTCAAVQGLKIHNFTREHGSDVHGHFAYAGVALAAVLLLLNILHIIFLIFYPVHLGLGFITFSYILVASCLMLPILHHMILRQEADGQEKREVTDSWAI